MADALAFEGVTVTHKGPILQDVSFSIGQGEAFGLVGESGCGKSTVALAAMRYLPAGMTVAKGRILADGRDVALASKAEMRALRGRRLAMVYQDPMSSLNPVMTIGRQLVEVPLLHGEADRRRATDRAIAMLREVRIPDPEAVMTRYPFQLSGGQQQRVVIAMALMAEPALLIMDEPTTGLDVTIEAAILDLVRDLREKLGTAVLFISHNLGTVARLCNRIGVLYAGRLVEAGPTRAIFRRPAHPYTRGLMAAVPRIDAERVGLRLKTIEGVISAADRARIGCAFAPRCPFAMVPQCVERPLELQAVTGEPGHSVRCVRHETIDAAALDRAGEQRQRPTAGEAPILLEVEHLTKSYELGGPLSRRRTIIRAVKDVSLIARRGETLAIVGESGSGKSTLARVLSGLTEATAGQARLGGSDLAQRSVERRSTDLRRRIQMMFQNPDSTLNPSHTVEFTLSRPLRLLRGLKGRHKSADVARLMEQVRLTPDLLKRKPHQLSGGQRQRVALARALAGGPELIIADEPVSALDVSVQAAIVNLLHDLQSATNIGLILISHDLGLVRHMADWVAVMYFGQIVEQGPAARVFAPPHHPYTRALLAAAPRLDADAATRGMVLAGAMPNPTADIRGCPFASRCPDKIAGLCETAPPPLRRFADGHDIACHLDLDRPS